MQKSLSDRESMHPVLAPYHAAAMTRASERMSAKEMQTIRAELSRSRPLLEAQFGKADPEARKLLDLGYTSRPIDKNRIAHWAENHSGNMAQNVLAANFNPFRIQAQSLVVDALSDSGSSTHTVHQTSLLGAWKTGVPEIETVAYGGLEPFAQLKSVVKEIFGGQFAFYPALQGRATENLLFTSLRQLGITNKGDLILSNRPFDTTKGHIEANGMNVDACTPMADPEKYRSAKDVFLGNINLEEVRSRLAVPNNVKAILVTVTDNGGGGQPVSMENVKKAAEIAREHGLILHIDACRIFENAMFVKLFEPGYENKTLVEITKEMLSYADVVTISFKKMYSHTGGALLVNSGSKLLKPEDLGGMIQKLTTVAYGNGFESYAGLQGTELIEIISGLYEATNPYRIGSRILQISDVYDELQRGFMVPVVAGAHALYFDSGAVLPNVKPEMAAAEYFNAMVMASLGVRGCGLGHKLYAKWQQDGDGEFVFKTPPTEMDSLRFAIPRETYRTDLLTSVFSSIGRAYGEGVFQNLEGGLKAVGFNTSGFYHFEAKYKEVKPGEFMAAVNSLGEFMPR